MKPNIPSKQLFLGATLAARTHDGLTMDINELLVKNEASTFFFKVAGNAMQNANIFPGDILIVDRSLPPTDKSIIIAVIEGELTIRRIRIYGKIIFLENDHDEEAPLEMSHDIDNFLWGIVTHTIHTIKPCHSSDS